MKPLLCLDDTIFFASRSGHRIKLELMILNGSLEGGILRRKVVGVSPLLSFHFFLFLPTATWNMDRMAGAVAAFWDL